MEWTTPFNDINQLTQGSIVDGINWGDEDNPVSIVLSNACDLEHEHASYLIVAALYPASAIIGNSREYKGMTNQDGFSASSKKQKIAVENKLSDYIHHRNINRYYFIDCTASDLDMFMMVDFQRILSLPIDIKNSLIPIAQLNTPLKEQMMMQFVSYTSRIPTDRVSQEDEQVIKNKLLEEIIEFEK